MSCICSSRPLVRSRRHVAEVVLLSVSLLLTTGCLTERSFPMHERDLRHIAPQEVKEHGVTLSTRAWAAKVHEELRPLLPMTVRGALLTDDLRGVDVYAHYGIVRQTLDSVVANFQGINRSAAVVPSANTFNDTKWPGYAPVEIVMDDGLPLSVRLAAPAGREIEGSYVVVAHGLFGQSAGYRQYDLCQALRAFGHHVVTVDMRGHGETGRLHPEYPITFGLDEPRDLLTVSRFLRVKLHADRIGLVGFSMGAHQALMTAWLDGDSSLPDSSTVASGSSPSPITVALHRPPARPAFDGGIFVISPVLNMVEYADSLNTRHTVVDSPVRAIFQDKVEARMRQFGAKPSRSMWDLMEEELRRSSWAKRYKNYWSLMDDNLSFIDFCAHGSGAHRMESARVPVLIIQAADDPITGSAQAVADVFGHVTNPNCGVILLREGGHGGFPALSSSYYYSLLHAFFDPKTSPRPAGDLPDLAKRDAEEPVEPMRLSVPAR